MSLIFCCHYNIILFPCLLSMARVIISTSTRGPCHVNIGYTHIVFGDLSKHCLLHNKHFYNTKGLKPLYLPSYSLVQFTMLITASQKCKCGSSLFSFSVCCSMLHIKMSHIGTLLNTYSKAVCKQLLSTQLSMQKMLALHWRSSICVFGAR